MWFFSWFTLLIWAQSNEMSAEDVIRLVRQRDLKVQVAIDEVEVRKAMLQQAGQYPNPVYSWTQERLVESTEEAHLFRLPVPVSAQRNARKRLSEVALAQAQSTKVRITSQAISQALVEFYQLLAMQQRIQLQRQGVQRLATAAKIVQRRQKEGTASGYDLIRLQAAEQLMDSELRQLQTQYQVKRIAFWQSLQLAETVTLRGDLQPDEKLISNLEQSRTKRRSVQILETETRAANKARKAAALSWFPQVALTGGLRRLRSSTEQQGYDVGMNIDIPIFSSGGSLRARSKARQALAGHRLQAVQREIAIARQQSILRLQNTRHNWQQFSEFATPRIKRLEKAAQSGYREGRFSIVELLDAQHTRLQLELQQLRLAVAVKVAEVSFCAARGDYE